MLKARTKEEFDALQVRIAEQEAKRREVKSSLPPRNQWVKSREPVSFNEVYTATDIENKAISDAREVEIAASPYAMDRHIPWAMLPPNDPLRIEEKRKHFEDERLRLEALQAKVLEYQNNGTSVE